MGPRVESLVSKLSKQHSVHLCHSAEKVEEGDILFLLGCTKIIGEGILKRNRHNLVVHESDLPKGRGWSPVAWQVSEGKNEIPIVLFEANQYVDSGPIYLRDKIILKGDELLSEIRDGQWEMTEHLVRRFIENHPYNARSEQVGEVTYYRKRERRDDNIDPEKSLAEIFDKLRIVDNDNYPAWFEYRGKRYLLKIYKDPHDKDK